MSGLAAVLAHAGPLPQDTVERMLRAAPHRGTALRIETAGPCTIGISEGEFPGLASLARDGRWTAALVGNLDNCSALAAELSPRAEADRPHTPAQTALAAFRSWGPAAVKRFRGAFAGVVWDGEILWSFRDQVGFQPLFYRADARAFYVAGEAKQVAAGAGLSGEPDTGALEVIFYRGIGEDTAVKGVRRFLSSALAEVHREGRLVLDRYWDPSPLMESARIGPSEVQERLVGLLEQAVQRVVTGSDAVTLSGGIDSPTVAAFAAPHHQRLSHRPLVAINTSYPDFPSVEEGGYARRVAEYLGIPLRTHVLTSSPIGDLELWTRLADGPWDTLPIPAVLETYRLARSIGAHTVLTGELAEYVYTVSPSLLGHLLWHGRWRALSRYASALVGQGRSWRAVGRRILRESVPATVGKAYARMANRRTFHYPDWVDVTAVGGSPHRGAYADSPRRQWRRAQVLATRGTTSTLEADEIAATYSGVRTRRPLADVDLWEFFLSLPAEVKFPDPVPKSLIRQVMRGRLPDEILDRRSKTVFDEYALGTADFEGLLRWVDPTHYRMRGVDYERLRSRLQDRTVTVNDLLWAYDLAKVHAFVVIAGRTGEYPPFGVYTGARTGW